MTCDDIQALLVVRQELSWADSQIVQTHLQTCEACQAFWAGVQETKQALRLLPIVPAQLDQQTVTRIAQRIAHDQQKSSSKQLRPLELAQGIFATLLVGIVLFAAIPWLAAYSTKATESTPLASQATNQTGPTQAPAILEATGATAASQPALTILVLGSDARPNQSEPLRTDSITLVRFDRARGQVNILSLPRDLWIRYPDNKQGPLYLAYSHAEQASGQGAGSAFAKQAVSESLDIPIDYVVVVRFAAFVQFIDRIGGVTITVPEALDDLQYPTDDYGTTAVHFAAGTQTLDGQHALMYARIRHGGTEFQRIQRQEQLVMAMLTQLHAQGILQQPTAMLDFFAAVRDAIDTDIPKSVLLDLAQWGPAFDQVMQISMGTVDEAMVVPLDPPATFSLKTWAREQIKQGLLGER